MSDDDQTAGESPSLASTRTRRGPSKKVSENLSNLSYTLNLNFSDTYKKFRSDAYKRLILDAAMANTSLFIHRDEVATAWGWVDPIIEAVVSELGQRLGAQLRG